MNLNEVSSVLLGQFGMQKEKNRFQIPTMYTSMNIMGHVLNHFQELKEAKQCASHGKMMPGLRMANLAFANGAEPIHDDAGGF